MGTTTIQIAVILTDGFADWEYGFLCGIGKAFYGLNIKFYTTNNSIKSQGGLLVQTVEPLDNISVHVSAVVVIGGTIWESNAAPDISSVLLKAYNEGSVIAGICGGTLALARAGLLNDNKHTSNSVDFIKSHAQEYQGDQNYRASFSAISSNRIITAAGTTPVSFTAAIFESVGLDTKIVSQFSNMLAKEHQKG